MIPLSLSPPRSVECRFIEHHVECGFIQHVWPIYRAHMEATLMPCKLLFCQPLTPVANNLFLSFLVGFIPILVVLVLLGIVRLPAWQAALAGLVVGFLIAIFVWQMPFGLAASSTLSGFAFALVPVMWIVWNAMWLYNIAVRSGKFELFRRWIVYNVPADKRIILLIIGFSFGAPPAVGPR